MCVISSISRGFALKRGYTAIYPNEYISELTLNELDKQIINFNRPKVHHS